LIPTKDKVYVLSQGILEIERKLGEALLRGNRVNTELLPKKYLKSRKFKT